MGQVWSSCCSNYKYYYGQGENNNKEPINDDGEKRKRWSDLPNLVLYAIAIKLGDIPTIIVYGRTCRSWRSVYKEAMADYMASQPPLLMLLPRVDCDNYWYYKNLFFDVTATKMLRQQSPTDLVHKSLFLSRRPDQYFLSQPCPNQFNRDVEILPFVTYKQTGRYVGIADLPTIPVVGGDFITGILYAPLASDECQLILFYVYVGGFHIRIKKGEEYLAASAATATAAAKWTRCPYPDVAAVNYVQQAIVIKDTLYCISFNRCLLFMELSGPRPSEMKVLQQDGCWDSELMLMKRCVLGDWDGDLLILGYNAGARHESHRRLVLLRLDSSTRSWMRMENLGGRSLFVSSDTCETFDAGGGGGGSGGGGIMRECIYFAVDLDRFGCELYPVVVSIDNYEVYSFPDGKRMSGHRVDYGEQQALSGRANWFYPKPCMITGLI